MSRKAEREKRIQEMGELLRIFEEWPEERKKELEDWETDHLGKMRQPGVLWGTSDWPGWEKYLGKKHPLATP